MYCLNCGEKLVEEAAKCLKCGAEVKKENSNNFYSYDYLTIESSRDTAGRVIDCYENFGWKLVDNIENSLFDKINLNFKRNRKVKNKDQLTRLQIKLEDNLKGIKVLEKKKTNAGFILSLITGIIGTLIFGGGMSLCLYDSTVKLIVGGIGIALVGVIVAIFAYPIYKRLTVKNATKFNPLIANKYEEIDSLCEKANGLLA